MSFEQQPTSPYVLLTAAHNEEAFIEGTIQSVLSQSLRPLRWVIVSDNSRDRTDEIIEKYARQHGFIRFLRITRSDGHNFGAKVIALNKGLGLLEGVSYEFIGNLDADLSLESNYFEELIARFRQNPQLGLTGGFVYENYGVGYQSRKINEVRNVAHAAQLVRSECYRAIGGYQILRYGGEDWYAQTKARMIGWQAESVPELKIFHHRHTGGGSSPVKNAFRLGKLDYSFGSDPAFEVVKCLRRIHHKPYVMGALTRLAGFVWLSVLREKRPVPDEFVAFLRREQQGRLSSVFNFVRPVSKTTVASQNSAAD